MQSNLIIHQQSGEIRNESTGLEVHQVQTTQKELPGLTNSLMEKIAESANLLQAFKAVKRNKGVAGVDRQSIQEFTKRRDHYIVEIQKQLLSSTYHPEKVLGVQIPKPKGGVRQLGIPTVKDRVVQQAISQVLTPIFDPTFSDNSYGFRPKRSAQQAIEAARNYVADGRIWVVDMDLEKFFDKVNHDVLMGIIVKSISDKSLLKLIRDFLTAGIMQDGLAVKRTQGTPQGGPLSPLLANIMLDQLDKELEKRKHTFCRYADDCNIYVKSEAAAKRVLKSISNFISKRLKLTVNQNKSAADKIAKRQFLGFRILNDATVTIAPDTIKRIYQKIRLITRRNRGISLKQMITQVNASIIGWYHYFKIADTITPFRSLDAWIRRKLRCFRLKQRKRKYSIKTFLTKQGADQPSSWSLAKSDKGWWRMSLNPIAHLTMSNSWFGNMGLKSLETLFVRYKQETAVCDSACTVV